MLVPQEELHVSFAALVKDGNDLIEAAKKAKRKDAATAFQAVLDATVQHFPIIRGEHRNIDVMKASGTAMHKAIGDVLAIGLPPTLSLPASNWLTSLHALMGRTPKF